MTGDTMDTERRSSEPCPTCKGTGAISPDAVDDLMLTLSARKPEAIVCPTCDGDGYYVTEDPKMGHHRRNECPDCDTPPPWERDGQTGHTDNEDTP